MKKRILLIAYCLLLTAYCLYAQSNKYWASGRKIGLDFRSGACIVDTNNQNKYASTDVNSQILDNSGNTLFWTNGYVVLNKNYDTLSNGTNFNHSINDNAYIKSGGGLPLPKGCIMIPNPKDSNNLFWMFYLNLGFTDPQGGSYLPSQLKCLLIDKRLNNGLGDVVFKDSLIVSDSLMPGNLFAIKHGNGINWWIVVRQYHTNKFYKILIDSSGINTQITQNIGTSYSVQYFFGGSGDVSQDGTKLAYPLDIYSVPSGVSNPNFQIDVIDFDRCTGVLSKPININYNFYPDTCEIFSVCFSPDRKILYGNRLTKLYQFYLDSTNIYQSKEIIQRYNGAVCPTNTWFWQMKRGVDDKIYMDCWGGVNCMHVINNPDVIGTGCNFIQNQLTCPLYHVFDVGFPNTPNFKLGAMNCNVGIENIATETNGLNIYPNPTNSSLTISSNQTIKSITVYNLVGKEILNSIINKKSENISLAAYSNGLYFIKAITENGEIFTKKIVKE